jgi:hypothetical protein
VAGGVSTIGGTDADGFGTTVGLDSVNGSEAVAPGVTHPLSVIVWLVELCVALAGVCAAANADAAQAIAIAVMIRIFIAALLFKKYLRRLEPCNRSASASACG